MKSALVIINKKSGKEKFTHIKETLRQTLKAQGFNMTVNYTTADNGSQGIITELNKAPDLLVIVGGDGTVSDVINQLYLHNINIPIAIIPTGTTNDLARVNDVPLNAIKAAESIQAHSFKEIDVLKINNFYASYLVAFGNFMTSFARVSTNNKKRFGRLAYLFSSIKIITHLKKYRVQLKTDILDIEIDSVFTIVSSISSVGSLDKLLPTAKADDGLLHILNISPVRLFEVPKILYLALLGRITEHPKVTYLTAKNVSVRTQSLSHMNIDGDLHPYKDSDIEVLEHHVSLVEYDTNPQ